MTLYLKYRSQTIDELDIKDVRETLKQIVKSGNIPHALLFLGPKGTGKTSAARILAKAVNCEKKTKDGEPCNACSTCKSISKGENFDVVEIDAASNRGIDDVRGLRDAVKLSPVSSKMKVYIIDEAHMLTTEASNALLKTLEEPPAHVMFILATTNPEKLIETIRSRTTNILFRKAAVNEILDSLNRVIKGEGIKAKEESLKLIADYADGSFRDAVKLLDELVSGKKELKMDDVLGVISKKGSFDIDVLIKYLEKKNTTKALESIEAASTSGVASKSIITSLAAKLKNSLLAKVGIGVDDLPNFPKVELIRLLKFLSEASNSSLNSVVDQLALEVAIIEWCGSENKKNDDNEKVNIKKVNDKKEEGVEKVNNSSIYQNRTNSESTISTPFFDEEIWTRIMSQIKPINASTEALLRASHPINFEGSILNLAVYYKFHKERLEGLPHRRILEDALSQVMGEKVRVVCTLEEPPIRTSSVDTSSNTSGSLDVVVPNTVLTETEDKDIIKVAEEIFGN
jgi:DNA polymerase-3 subunit gamma/tau